MVIIQFCSYDDSLSYWRKYLLCPISLLLHHYLVRYHDWNIQRALWVFVSIKRIAALIDIASNKKKRQRFFVFIVNNHYEENAAVKTL